MVLIQAMTVDRVSGVVRVKPYTGTNLLFLHGPLRVSANKRYLEHLDGKPFFFRAIRPGETPSPEGRKFFPTLVVDPTDDMLCMKEEIFGPVLPVLGYERLEEAIAHVNARPRPLA